MRADGHTAPPQRDARGWRAPFEGRQPAGKTTIAQRGASTRARLVAKATRRFTSSPVSTPAARACAHRRRDAAMAPMPTVVLERTWSAWSDGAAHDLVLGRRLDPRELYGRGQSNSTRRRARCDDVRTRPSYKTVGASRRTGTASCPANDVLHVVAQGKLPSRARDDQLPRSPWRRRPVRRSRPRRWPVPRPRCARHARAALPKCRASMPELAISTARRDGAREREVQCGRIQPGAPPRASE